MDYCGPAGVPLTTFRGWDAESYGAALAWQHRRDESCGRCGQSLDESTGEGMRDGYTALPVVCGGCASIDRGSRTVRRDQGNGDHTAADGIRWRVVRDE